MFRVIFAALAVALTALWLFVWRAPLGAGNWHIVPNDAAWPPGAWLLPIGVLLIFGGAAALSVYDRFRRAKSRKEQTNSTVTALVCLAIVGMLWPWALLGPGKIQSRSSSTANIAAPQSRPTLEGRFNIIAALWSDVATEYFGAAYTFDDARVYAHDYARTQQHPQSRIQAHVATHPPGAVLWFYGVRKLYESSPALQNGLTSLAQTVTGQTPAESASLARLSREAPTAQRIGVPNPPPLPDSAIGAALLCAILLGLSLVAALPAVYGLGAIGGGAQSEKRGLIAAALWILAPTTNLFAFTLDALVACGAVWTLYFAALGWNRMAQSSTGTAPAASKAANFWWIASGVALALTTFLSIGAFAVGAILVVALLIYRPRGAVAAIGLAVAAFVAVWLMLALWGGFNPLEIAFNAGRAHRFATLETRGYWPWVWLNLVMWALFMGWPAVALLARGVKLYKESAMRASGFGLGVATLGVLVLLCLSGNVRGEAERLWLFALPPLCVVAAFCPGLRPRHWAVFLGLQALQTLLMAATLAPLVRPF